MFSYQSICRGVRFAAVLTAMGVSIAAAPAMADEITITIDRVRAVDRADVLSKPDFLARVTIAGETFVTKPVLNSTDIKPGWSFTKSVPAGTHKVKVEILDKDITKNDVEDINRVDNKRDLDFTVSTRPCRIREISNASCGVAIVRAGKEKKAAEITFTVKAKKTK